MIQRIRRFGIGAVLIALVAAFLVAPQVANAANNPHIKVTLDSLTPITHSGEPIANPGQLYVGDWVLMKVTFDASSADPVPGDSFSVRLPAEFANVEFGRPGREVVKPLMFGGTEVGGCLLEQRVFTCTFNDSIVGQERVIGGLSARLSATNNNDDGTATFEFNGVETEVPIPGNGTIATRTTSFQVNGRAGKGATGVGPTSTGVTWVIGVGGGWLAANLPGQTEFTIIDTLPNTLLKMHSNRRLITLSRSNPALNGQSRPVAYADGTALVEGYGISVEASPDGMTHRIKVKLPMEVTDQENYSISFPTVLTDGGTLARGWTYTNNFSVEGVDQTFTGFKGYSETFMAEARFEPNMGTFNVTKTAQGSGNIAASQKFAAKVYYELPANYSAPANWTPPANPFSVDIELGTPTTNPIHLPAGTKVTLVEDLDRANATAADGVTWVSPKWASLYSSNARKFTITENGAKAAFVIEDQTNLGLTLTNTSVTQATFEVVKKVVGDDYHRFAADLFDFTYSCTDPSTGTVTTGRIEGVSGTGTPARPKADDGSDKTFPVGTVCTVSEVDPGAYPGYTITPATDAKVTVMNSVQTATMVNTYEADAEMFYITKNLNAGNSRGLDTFLVAFECTQDGWGVNVGDKEVTRNGYATITAGEATPVGRFPVGTSCRVTEEDDQTRQGFDLSKDLGTSVVITEGGDNTVTVSNTYTMQMGTFRVSKAVAGDQLSGVDTSVPLTIAYTCTPPLRTGLAPITGQVTQEVDLATGGDIPIQAEFPVNTECVLTAETGAELDGYTLATNLGDEVKISKDEVKAITLTNTYTRDTGEFTITKDLAEGGSTGSDQFEVTYTCTEPARDGGDVTTATVTVTAGQPHSVGRFPTGTQCQVDQETPIERTGYSQEIQITDPVTLVKDQTSNVTVRNIYTRDYAEFLVAKQVVANGSTGSDTFEVYYECDEAGLDAGGAPVAASGWISVTANQSVEVGKFPTGGNCKVTQERGAERTNFDLDVDYGNEVTITRGVPAVTTVTNTYTAHTGTVKILKQEQGLPATNTPRTVSLTYQCTPPTGLGSVSSGSVEVTVGQEHSIGEYPVGTECQVTSENVPAVADYSVSKDLGTAVTVVQGDATPAIQVTNTYTRDTGYFSIAKQVNSGGSTGNDTFSVSYSCEVPATAVGDQAQTLTDTVEVSAGQTKRIGEFPVGTVCSVTEDEAAAARTDYDLTVDLGTPVTVNKDVVAVSTITNTYSRQMGPFLIEKQVVPGGSTGSDQFTLDYECDPPGDTDPVTGTVVVTEGVQTVVGTYPTGTICRVTDENTQLAARDGYNLTVDKGTDYTVTNAPDPAPAIVVNTYTRQQGTFQITKNLVADGSTGSDVFKVNYECAVPGEADPRVGFVNVTAGTTEDAGTYPTGTVCSVTSEENTSRPGWTLTEDLAQPVTITEGGPNVATVTNTYSRDHGIFAISKVVNDGGSTGTDTFSVTYSCTAAGKGVAAEGTVNVTAGQETVVGEFPTGTTCQVTNEDRDAAKRDNYTLGVSFGEQATIEKDTKATVTVTNTYERQRGGFVINKTIAGDAADSAPKTFSFTYTCADSAPTTVEVTAGQPFTVTDVPTGQCTITEADASVQYTDLVTEFTVDGAAVATGSFEVKDQTTTDVGVTNTYTAHRGTFAITKEIAGGDDNLAAGPFTFTYDCAGTTGTLEVPGDGTAVTGPELRLGTSCTIEEQTASAEVPGYELTAPASQTVELTKLGDPTPVHFVNTYRRHTADFSVAKTVTGGDFAASSYTFNYVCGAVTGSLTVNGDGVAVPAGVNLPTGTVCTVTEDAASAQRDGYSVVVPEAQQVTLGADGSVTELSFVNAYTKTPVQPTPDPSQPTPDPTQPTPDPSQPTPDPSQPTPDPTRPTPGPTQPTPVLVKPTPVPVKPGMPDTGR